MYTVPPAVTVSSLTYSVTVPVTFSALAMDLMSPLATVTRTYSSSEKEARLSKSSLESLKLLAPEALTSSISVRDRVSSFLS